MFIIYGTWRVEMITCLVYVRRAMAAFQGTMDIQSIQCSSLDLITMLKAYLMVGRTTMIVIHVGGQLNLDCIPPRCMPIRLHWSLMVLRFVSHTCFLGSLSFCMPRVRERGQVHRDTGSSRQGGAELGS